MLENRNEFRMLISSVLNRTNFYFLPLAKLTEILKLLDMPETSQPNAILQCVFTGIIRLYQKYKEKIGSYLFNEKFNTISKESKELLYTIFVHISNQLLIKPPPPVMHSMSMPPYNMGMIYPQMQNPTINLETPTNGYEQEMKKYYDAAKMYYYMNPQYGSSINPSISSNPPSMNHSLPTQYGMPIPNGYMGYPGGSPMSMQSFNQMKNPQRNIPATNMSFGMSPYGSTMPSTFYQPQYMNPYPGNAMGAYGQTPPSFSHMNGLDKSELNSKGPQVSGFLPNNEFEKRYLSNQNNKIDLTQKNERQKVIMKDPKLMSLPNKNSFNPALQNLLPHGINKADQKAKLNDIQSKKVPPKETKKLGQQNSLFKVCACKGYSEYQSSFICSICKNKFHYRCLSLSEKLQDYTIEQIACAHCKMRTMDPLNKIQQILGQYYLTNLFQKAFQTVINFKPYESKCKEKNSKYEIEVRNIRSGEHMKNLQITWPDECIIKINNEKIVDVPALQSNSSLKKRKDFSVFFTPNIFAKTGLANVDGSSVLEKIKISLELKTLTPEQASGKRIRNDFTFALGIYLVEKLNTDELYAKIMSEQKIEDENFLKNLMKTKEDEIQIDKITIRLTDPFSWDFIKTPVRGQKCNHAQCFDLKTFISLMLSAKNRTWKCPLCSRDARKFMVDNQQLDLLHKAQQIEPMPKQVQIFKQGKIAFKVEKDSQQEDEGASSVNKTKKIVKEKKEEK